MSLNQYHVTEQLYDSAHSAVLRAVRKVDSRPVILKCLKTAMVTVERRARFKREFELARSLNPGTTMDARMTSVIETYGLHMGRERWIIEQEDFGGDSISRLLELRSHAAVQERGEGREPLPLAQVLHIAVAVVRALAGLQQRQIIHRDLNPQNIVFNTRTGDVKLIDFGLSRSYADVQPQARTVYMIEGTLPYMAPEQSGRMNRSVDYRCDFYSLGVTLYELLTGVLPFRSNDPLELIHSHIARAPLPPHELNPLVPRALSAIVLKLMAKNAEDRYQHAWGIEADLQRVADALKSGDSLADFVAGTNDLSDRLQIPKKLYGREAEVAELLAAFERIVQGGPPELLLVSGYSGIGKSALIYEVYKPVTQHRGYFAAGKFDQFQRSVPYRAVSQVLGDLVSQVQTEDKEAVARWRENIQKAVAPNGKLLTDLVPELELLIGPQPDVAALEPSESENRFQLTILNFIAVFCRPEHPLVLFMDDLQWANPASLRLREILLTSELRNLFLIGAYRDNEVDATHPLSLSIARMRKEGVPITEVALQPLSSVQLSQLLCDALRTSEQRAAPLTQLLFSKTGGNPFFVGEFLKTLEQERLLTLSEDRAWTWNMEAIHAKAITDNVVDLLLAKLRKLPSLTQDALRLSACIGSRFDLRTLSVVHERPLLETAVALRPALQEGFIVATSAAELVSDAGPDESGTQQMAVVHYRFAHDRVQQAAYSLIGEEQRRAVHLQIGTLLWRAAGESPHAEQLFEIVGHLNRGSALVSDVSQRVALSQLNLDAAVRAREATAYQAAQQYASEGLALLPPTNAPEFKFELSFALNKELAQASYQMGEHERSEVLLRQLLEQLALHITPDRDAHRSSALRQVELYSLLITQYTLTGRYDQAIAAGRRALGLLGIGLPDPDNEREVSAAFEAEAALIQKELASHDIAKLLDRPLLQSPEKLWAMRVLVSMNAAGMYTSRPLYNLLVAKKVSLSLEHGHSAESAFAYVSFGVPLSSVGGGGGSSEHVRQAYAIGMMARELSLKWDRLDLRCRVHFILGTYILPWSRHLRHLDAVYDEGYRAGMQGGELLFAGNILAFRLLVPFYLGRNVQELIEEARRFLLFERKTKNKIATDRVLACFLPLLNLAGGTASPQHFAPTQDEHRAVVPAESDLLSAFLAHGSHIAICVYKIAKAQCLYLSEQPEAAFQCLQEIAPRLSFIAGSISVVEHQFYLSLCAAALCRGESEPRRSELLSIVSRGVQRFAVWASTCPDNFLHKQLLLEALHADLVGDAWRAMQRYEQAIANAAQQEFNHIEALACECLARFWIAHGKEDYARTYLLRAFQNYKAWGVMWKAERLEERLAERVHLVPESTATSGITAGRTTVTRTHSSTTSSDHLDEAMDLRTVLKASQAIAGEIILSTLLDKLVDILIESAGADRGSLLFEQSGTWVVAASASVSPQAGEGGRKSEPRVATQSQGSAGSEQELPAAIVNFVAHRRQDLVLNNVAQDGPFVRDPYVRARRPQSVLCMPLTKQGRILAILYLENNLAADAFTPRRLEMLRLLSAQMAISIENAQLYAQLEDRVRARTQELSSKNAELSDALRALRETQQQLVQREKLASLGALTAGIAHELKNPLNFINNFAQLSVGLADEIETDVNQLASDDSETQENVAAALQDLKENLQRINHHGQRADRIIHSMLLHSRERASSHGPTDINRLLNESLNLAYHGMRARQPGWNVELRTDFDESVGTIAASSGDLSRVFINLFDNAFYATQRRRKDAGPDYSPTVRVSSRRRDSSIEIRVRDNGTGLSKANVARLFTPFFTTKPAGEGVGLGLSISHDIIVQGHQGEIRADSVEGEYMEFIITLPCK
ncbi:MAG: AAA family ATPase [Myxococcales bacterium]|nr:AAA family ATPase [Myxococcales bacterium]